MIQNTLNTNNRARGSFAKDQNIICKTKVSELYSMALRMILKDPLFHCSIGQLRKMFIDRTKRWGDNGSSCLMPRALLKMHTRLPLKHIENREVVRHAGIRCLNLKGKPMASRTTRIKFQLRELKALFRSTFRAQRADKVFLAYSFTSSWG